MTTPPPALAPDTDAIADAEPWFSEATVQKGHIALRCARDLPADFEVHAIVGGIRIGSASADPALPVKAGDVVQLTCDYYPNKGLPNEIRFAMEGSDVDAAPAIPLTSISQVVALVGYDPLDSATLHAADGVLRGTAINRTNAHKKFQPPLICRVNGQEIRDVSLDKVTPHPGGGAWISFSTQIRPTDLFDTGALYEIFALPDMTPVASKSFAPVSGGDDQDARLARVEAEIAQLSRRMTTEMTETREAARKMQQNQLRLIDSFAEYMLSVVFDRLGSGSAETPGSVEEDAAISAFRQLISDSAGDAAGGLPPASVPLSLHDISANRGWFSVETRKKGASFLWMGRTGSFKNPYPETPITLVSIAVQSTVSPDILPITVLIDGEVADVEILPDLDTRPFRLNIRPRGGQAKPAHTIDLLPDRALSPKDVGTSEDARKLSIAISSVTIHYDLAETESMDDAHDE